MCHWHNRTPGALNIRNSVTLVPANVTDMCGKTKLRKVPEVATW